MERSTICLGMMVKNESHVIRRVLASAKPHIDAWCIVDTGSTDGTQDIIREELDGIPGKIHDSEWTNHFGNHRTEVFELASKHADYVLMLDADDVLLSAPGFKFGKLEHKGYEVKISMGNTSWNRLALLRSDRPWKYHSPIHEWAQCKFPGDVFLLVGLHIIAMTDGRRRTDDPVEKYNRDVETLKAELEKNPNDPRSQFYLAQSYRDARRPEEAIEAYRKRAEMTGGWPEEAWFSRYQVGVLCERLGRKQEALDAYVEAFEFRPSRAEPLTKAASLARRQKQYGLAWMYALAAMHINDTKDSLFVDSSVYQWRALDEYAVACYWMGRYRESQVLTKSVLKLAPAHERKRIQKNLDFCNQQLAPVRKKVGKPSGRKGKKIIITGAGRSGTGYVAKVLTDAGIRCGHEVVFGPFTEAIEWGEYDADSSWLAVPWLSTLGDDVVVVHLVRDFLACGQSWAGVGQFDDNPDHGHGPYRDVVERFAPGVMQIEDRLGRIAAYWTTWNEAVTPFASMSFRTETLTDMSFVRIFETANASFDADKLRSSVEAAPKNTNSRKRDETLTLADFQEATPDHIWSRLEVLRNRFEKPIR